MIRAHTRTTLDRSTLDAGQLQYLLGQENGYVKCYVVISVSNLPEDDVKGKCERKKKYEGKKVCAS